MVGSFFNSFHSKNDWIYEVEPEKYACWSVKSRGCYWPRGKTLGGSSSINAMFYVRGHKFDFDDWSNLGNEGWSYEEVLPYFKKSESLYAPDIPEDEQNTYHGHDGFLSVQKHIGINPFSDILMEAYNEFGVKTIPSIVGERGTGVLKTLATVHNGRRMSTARSFLTPIKDRSNLFVLKNTLVTNVIIDESSFNAIGIETDYLDQKYIFYAKKEVILSAGAVNTPQILMLSGIGPKKHLDEIGIRVLKDLPVGYNLQDHIVVHNIIQLATDLPTMNKEEYSLAIAEYIALQTGPISNVGTTEVVSFVDVFDINNDVPNIQYHHFLSPTRFSEVVDIYKEHNFEEQILKILEKQNEFYPFLDFFSVLLKPKSAGYITLKNADPKEKPLIFANYFDHPDDMLTILQSMRFVTYLLDTPTFKKYNASLPRLPLPTCEGYDFQSDDYFMCVAKYLTTTLFHPIGTARMGPYEDSRSVVSPQLKVHGINNLRVVDASVMPEIVRGNTNAATIMIAEKASDLIKEFWWAN